MRFLPFDFLTVKTRDRIWSGQGSILEMAPDSICLLISSERALIFSGLLVLETTEGGKIGLVIN